MTCLLWATPSGFNQAKSLFWVKKSLHSLHKFTPACPPMKCRGSGRGRVRRQPHEGELGEGNAPAAVPALARAGRVPSLRGGRSGRGRGG